MAAAGRKQVMITTSEKLLARIDAYCDENGVSRSAFFTVAAGDKLSQYEMSKDAIARFVSSLNTPDALAALASVASASDNSGE